MYNFKTLTGNTKFLSYKEWGIGNYVVGTVERFQENKKSKDKQDVIVTVIESNLKIQGAKLVKGDMFTINGTTALQKVLGAVEEGDIIKVTYQGQEEVKSGEWKGTKANKLDVQVAPAQDKAKFEAPSTEESEDLI